jgi:hypothetical protein
MPNAFLRAWRRTLPSGFELPDRVEPQLVCLVKSMGNIEENGYVRSDLGGASVLHDRRNDMPAGNRISIPPSGSSASQV